MDAYTNQGYILNNACDYEPFGHVFTFDQFIRALMQGQLPLYKTWIVGQGLSPEERGILRRLHEASPDIQFVMPMIDGPSIHRSPRTALHHLHVIAPFHYQAEVYFSSVHSPQATVDKLLPAWEVMGNETLHNASHRLSSDTSRLVDAIEALTVEGLHTSYPRGFIAIRDIKLHQLRKLFPLTVALEIQLFKAAYANSYRQNFSGKARFYQDEFCLAEASFHVDVESEDSVLAKDALAASRAFGEE